MEAGKISIVEDSALGKKYQWASSVLSGSQGGKSGTYLAPNIEIRDQQVVVLGRGHSPHIFLNAGALGGPGSRTSFRHVEEPEIIFGNRKDGKSMYVHSTRHISETPFDEWRVCHVGRFKNPMLGSNDLR